MLQNMSLQCNILTVEKKKTQTGLHNLAINTEDHNFT